MSIRLSNAERAQLRAMIKAAANKAGDTLAPAMVNNATKAELLALAAQYGLAPVSPMQSPDDFEEAVADAIMSADDDDNDDTEEETVADDTNDTDDNATDTIETAALADVAELQRLVGVMDATGFRDKALTLARLAHKPAETIEIQAPSATAGTARPQAHKTGKVSLNTAFGMKGTVGKLMVDTWSGGVGVPVHDKHYVFPALSNVILSKSLFDGLNVMMVGPAGTGKTSCAEQIAARLGRPFFRVSFHGQIEPAELLGQRIIMPDGSMAWADGLLLIAIQTTGAVILLDELDRARSAMLPVLQSILDSGYVTILETGHTVKCAPGVTFYAAGNTNGTGDTSGHYTAANQLDRATIDRMCDTVEVTYMDAASEQRVLIARTGCSAEIALALVTYAGVTRADVNRGELTHGVGLRRLTSLARSLMDDIPLDDALRCAVLNTAAPDDVERLALLAKTHLSIKPAASTGRGASDFTAIKE